MGTPLPSLTNHAHAFRADDGDGAVRAAALGVGRRAPFAGRGALARGGLRHGEVAGGLTRRVSEARRGPCRGRAAAAARARRPTRPPPVPRRFGTSNDAVGVGARLDSESSVRDTSWA